MYTEKRQYRTRNFKKLANWSATPAFARPLDSPSHGEGRTGILDCLHILIRFMFKQTGKCKMFGMTGVQKNIFILMKNPHLVINIFVSSAMTKPFQICAQIWNPSLGSGSKN